MTITINGTDQDIFSKVATHLLTQMARSHKLRFGSSSQYRCLYRDKANCLSCAIGCLLTDEDAKELDALDDPNGPTGGNTEILSLIERGYISFPSPKDTKLLSDLQLTHDSYDPPDWRRRLNDVAAKWSLSMPV